MPKGLTFLPSLALAAMMALPVAAETEPSADTVVARVNGDEITLGHVIATAASLPPQYQQLDATSARSRGGNRFNWQASFPLVRG